MNMGKDGRYHSSFRYQGRVYSVHGATEREVLRKIGEMKAELKAGARVKRKPLTVAKYAAEWVQTYHGTDGENDKDYQGIVKNHIVPALGHLRIQDVTESQLQRFLNEKAADLSASRVQKLKITLGQMFHKARKNHLISDDPAEDLTMPDCVAGGRRSLTDTERDLLLSVLPGHRGNLYCKVMLYCGLRPGEVNVLQGKHVDKTAGLIYVRQAMKHNSNVIGPPKSAAGTRDIPIPEKLVAELPDVAPDDYICSWNGGPISRAAQSRMWRNILREMDIAAGAKVVRNQIVESKLADDLALYCLRHTYCTDLQRAGVPINIAKELMGHEDIAVTANIYTHTGTEEAKAAVEKLDRLHIESVDTEIIQFPTFRAM